MVDLENAGWLDRAVDLADLVEHPRSRTTPDPAWTGLVERFALSPPERGRFEAARRLLAFFWLDRSLSGRGPSATGRLDRGRHPAQRLVGRGRPGQGGVDPRARPASPPSSIRSRRKAGRQAGTSRLPS